MSSTDFGKTYASFSSQRAVQAAARRFPREGGSGRSANLNDNENKRGAVFVPRLLFYMCNALFND